MYRRLSIGASLVIVASALATLPPVVSAQEGPLSLDRSVVVEEDGVRLAVSVEHNPVVVGEPLWITTRLTNTGKSDLVWDNGHCDSAVIVSGTMRDVGWRQGEPVSSGGPYDFARRTKLEYTADGSEISLEIEPEGAIGSGGYGCSEVGYTDRIRPGKSLTDRSRWDGYAQWQLGLPPSGVATLTGSFGQFKRAGDPGRADQSIEAMLDLLVVGGLEPDDLHPMEIVDAALADTAFASFVEPIEVGNGNDPYVQYDPELHLWTVGVVETRSNMLRAGLVDPVSGDVVAIIERPRGRDEASPSSQ